MIKTILITGGDGFLGSWLVRKLSQKFTIIVLEKNVKKLKRLNALQNKIKIFESSKESIYQIFEDNKIDSIIHTATFYGRESFHYNEYVANNIEFPLILAELCAYNKNCTFLNTDSFYNSNEFNYSYLYGYTLSKKQFNEWLKLLSNKLTIINLKLFHIYGPYDNNDKFIIQLLTSLLRNDEKILLTPGEQKRDFIYVEDVVEAYESVLNNINKFKNGFYQIEIGTGKSVSIKEFVNLAHQITNSKSKLLFGALPYRENEIMNSIANISKLVSLGWKPKFSLEEGLKEVINSLKNNIL